MQAWEFTGRSLITKQKVQLFTNNNYSIGVRMLVLIKRPKEDVTQAPRNTQHKP